MKSSIKWAASCLMVLAAGVAHAADPAVKKSSSGICHDDSSPNYKQLKDFTPYKTIDACLKSGGKMPAGVAAPAAAPAKATDKANATAPKSSDSKADTAKNQASTKDSKPAPAAKPANAKDTDAKASASTKPAASKASASGQIKKSSSGICHAPGTEYYDRTQNFEPFRTMSDCIKSGGREPK